MSFICWTLKKLVSFLKNDSNFEDITIKWLELIEMAKEYCSDRLFGITICEITSLLIKVITFDYWSHEMLLHILRMWNIYNTNIDLEFRKAAIFNNMGYL